MAEVADKNETVNTLEAQVSLVSDARNALAAERNALEAERDALLAGAGDAADAMDALAEEMAAAEIANGELEAARDACGAARDECEAERDALVAAAAPPAAPAAVSRADCLARAVAIFGDKVTSTRPALTAGTFNWVGAPPKGCSVQSNGDWSAHWNDGGFFTPVLAETEGECLAAAVAAFGDEVAAAGGLRGGWYVPAGARRPSGSAEGAARARGPSSIVDTDVRWYARIP